MHLVRKNVKVFENSHQLFANQTIKEHFETITIANSEISSKSDAVQRYNRYKQALRSNERHPHSTPPPPRGP